MCNKYELSVGFVCWATFVALPPPSSSSFLYIVIPRKWRQLPPRNQEKTTPYFEYFV